MNEQLIPKNEKLPVTPSQESIKDEYISGGEIWDSIKEKEGSRDQLKDAEELAERTGISSEKAQAILERPEFQGRLDALKKKKAELEKGFHRNVLRALVPVLGFGSPEVANAQQVSTDVVAVEPVATSENEDDEEFGEEKSEEEIVEERRILAEKLYGELFDIQSPLAYRSEKLPQAKWFPEDVTLLKSLQLDVLEKTEEQMVISGQGNFGDGTVENPYYVSEKGSLGKSGGSALGVIKMPENIDMDQEIRRSHTHPLRARREYLKLPESETEDKLYILPPSIVDITTCFQSASLGVDIRERVIDSKGMWEFKCSKDSSLGKKLAQLSLKSLTENNTETEYFNSRLGTGQQNLMEVYGIRQEQLADDFSAPDEQKAIAAIAEQWGMSPESVKKSMEALAEKRASDESVLRYPPRPSEEVARDLDEVVNFVLKYGDKQLAFLRNSADASPEENQKRIRDIVDFASQQGLEMSYTPFQEK
jgi:hypothetical protein